MSGERGESSRSYSLSRSIVDSIKIDDFSILIESIDHSSECLVEDKLST